MASFYVYCHQDKNGNVFYVGKGKGKRAWQRERHVMWELYVKRIGGEYEVKIVKENLDEDEAFYYEESLQMEFGGSLINWVNPGRRVNMEILDRYWKTRMENEAIFEQGKQGEKTNIDLAISL